MFQRHPGRSDCVRSVPTMDHWLLSRQYDIIKSLSIFNFLIPILFKQFNPKEMARKTCTESGEWFRHFQTNRSWSNYTGCVDWDDFEVFIVINDPRISRQAMIDATN